MRLRYSMAGRLALFVGAVALCSAGLAVAALRWWPHWFVWPLLAALIVMASVLAARYASAPWTRAARALADALVSLKDRDFSMSVAARTHDELGEVARSYNELGDRLRAERQSLYQRELLLDTVIQTTPLALVLVNAKGSVVYSNLMARQLFGQSRKFDGAAFDALVRTMPQALQEALARRVDSLFTLEWQGEPQVYHVSQRVFQLNAQPHNLILLKQLTREINSQELATWKKVIRVIAHELNNSLAPISSLAHSGAQLVGATPQAAQLQRVFGTISERAQHLAGFIDGYARFAKLPQPRLTAVDWRVFLARLGELAEFRLVTEPPADAGQFDAAQIEHALINLLKNARESGSSAEQIELAVTAARGGFALEVRDRGAGFSASALDHALVPFYSTKASGTGLGLTLCREILEAHGGYLRLANRDGGGAIVTLFIPHAA
jgi:two-component system, NtrC family, nitrogen regulation sensor histidine kinase NtrY